VKIVVLVKQVPVSDNVKMNEETGTMIREGVEAELNPLDLYAVEEAVRLKEKAGDGVEVSVISMGPQKAVEAIKSALALGCDNGFLLTDKKFAGSDTWATAYALSRGIKKAANDFDIIFCGERATDGETGQVGPEVGTFLDLPVLTYVSKIEEIGDGKIKAHRAVEGGHEVVESPTPVLVSVIKEINEPRMPNLKGKIRAKKIEIPVLGVDDIEADPAMIGLKNSPTRVVKAFRPQVGRSGEIVRAEDGLDNAVDGLVDFLAKKALV